MEQRVVDAISEADIREVFEIISEVTSANRPTIPGTAMERRLEKLGEWVISHAMLGLLTMLLLAALAYYVRSEPLVATVISVGTLSMIFALSFFAVLILSAIPLILKIKKAPFSQFLSLVESSYTFDLQYARRLAQCDKRAVQYVLAYYKYERNGFEKRGSVLSGSIEKIGIFPALGALAILAVALSKITFASQWIQMIPPLILAFYFLNFGMFGMLQKKDRVITLLEYSIVSRS